MALQWIEGFELYGGTSTTPNSLTRKWDVGNRTGSSNFVPSATGALFGYAMKLGKNTANPDSLCTPNTLNSHATYIVGFRFRRTSTSYNNFFLLQLADYTSVVGPTVGLRINGTNIEACRCSQYGGVLNNSPTGGYGVYHRLITPDQQMVAQQWTTRHTWTNALGSSIDTNWYHVQFKFTKTSGSLGDVDLRVNGVSFGGTTGLNFQGNTWNGSSWDTVDTATTLNCAIFYTYMPFGSPNPSSHTVNNIIDLDDIYICDGSGSSNNDYLGTAVVEGLVPTGAGTNAQWTPNSGNNYAAVDDFPSDDDTSYISTTTVNNRDTYVYSNPVNTRSGLRGVMINAEARNIGGGTPTMSLGNYLSSSYTDGSALTVSNSAYEHFYQIQEGPWTATDVDDAEFGVKLESV